jgi:CBS domain-containing protein
MKNVSDIFKRKGLNNVSVASNAPVIDALKLMAEKNIGSAVVMSEDGKYMGLITERDYARKVVLHGKSSIELTAGEIMSEYLPKAALNTSLEDCMEMMSNHNVRYLPVFEAEEYVGVISIIDVVKETIMDQKSTIQDLQSYIQFAG